MNPLNNGLPLALGAAVLLAGAAVARHVGSAAHAPSNEAPTRVIFREWKDGEDMIGGGLIAVFPDIQADHQGHVQSYMHVGQHAAASLGIVTGRLTRPAPEGPELDALREELRRIGYVLHEIKRVPARGSTASGSSSRTSLRLLSPLGFAFVDATARERLPGQPAHAVVEVTHPGATGRGRSVRVTPGETGAGFAAANRGVVRLVLPHYGYKNGLDAFSYGENILVLVSDAEMPSYVLTLYSADDAGNYRVDQDIEVSGLREVEEFLGKLFETFRPVTIASKLLDRMS